MDKIELETNLRDLIRDYDLWEILDQLEDILGPEDMEDALTELGWIELQ